MFMARDPAIAAVEEIETKIHLIRGSRVMLDSDLAGIYGVQTMRLNEQFKRNEKRFPSDFSFQLTPEEFAALISQIAISKKGRGGRRKLPWVFTEHGAIMLASVLNSQRAVEMSVFVIRAFVRMRELVMANRQLAAKLNELEKRVEGHDEVIGQLVATMRELLNPPVTESEGEIGFHVREEAPPYRIRRRA